MVIGEILCLLRTLAKLARSEDQFPAVCTAPSRAPWVSRNVAGPLSGLGPDSSAASGRPFVTRDPRSLKIQGLVSFSFSLVGHLQTLLGCYFSICHGFFMASGGTLSFRIICGQCRLRCLLCFLEQWGSIPHPADMRSYHQKNIRRQFPRNFTTCCFPSRLFAMPHEDGTLLML